MYKAKRVILRIRAQVDQSNLNFDGIEIIHIYQNLSRKVLKKESSTISTPTRFFVELNAFANILYIF